MNANNIHRAALFSALVFGVIADPYGFLNNELVRIGIIVAVADAFYWIKDLTKPKIYDDPIT